MALEEEPAGVDGGDAGNAQGGGVGEEEVAGALQGPERANKNWKQILAEFEPPPLDPAIEEELREFVERRKREGGAPTDF